MNNKKSEKKSTLFHIKGFLRNPPIPIYISLINECYFQLLVFTSTWLEQTKKERERRQTLVNSGIYTELEKNSLMGNCFKPPFIVSLKNFKKKKITPLSNENVLWLRLRCFKKIKKKKKYPPFERKSVMAKVKGF